MGVITVEAEYVIQDSSCPQPSVNNKSLFSRAKHLSVSRAANGELRAQHDHNTLSHESVEGSTELRQVAGEGLCVALRAYIKNSASRSGDAISLFARLSQLLTTDGR